MSGIELNKPKGSRTQSQLTWDHGDSQVLDQQSGSRQELDLDLLHICSKCAAWCSCGFPDKWSRAFSVSVPCRWIFPLPELPSVGEDVPSPAGAGCPRVGWYPRKEKGRGNWEGGMCKGKAARRVRKGAVIRK